jgi:hypothetical protein
MRFILAAALLTQSASTVVAGDTAPSAAAVSIAADVKLPPGTRRDPAGHYVAGRGLRDSTDFLARELARRGVAVEQVGPYRVRGVELTRFLSQSPSTPWLAIHVLRTQGKTLIFFIPRTRA